MVYLMGFIGERNDKPIVAVRLSVYPLISRTHFILLWAILKQENTDRRSFF